VFHEEPVSASRISVSTDVRGPADAIDSGGLAASCAGLFLLSFGLLIVELALTRVFSYAISYHFAYLTIATAMLGFSGAGALASTLDPRAGRTGWRLVASAGLAGVTTSLVLAFSSVMRFDPHALTSDASALVVLVAYYVVVAVPFFCGGLTVATVLAGRPQRVGILYGADLVGAGLGCALAVGLMWRLGTPLALTAGATALSASSLLFAGRSTAKLATAAAATVLALGVGVAASAYGPFPPSPGKFLSFYMASPGVRHLYTEWTPLSRVDAIGWEKTDTSWRSSYAVSGVSTKFEGHGPELRMIGYDGGSFAVMYAYDGDSAKLDAFRQHVMAAPYAILHRPETLIIGLGGGADALAGIANGAGPMVGLELNPVTVHLGRDEFRDFNGGLFDDPRLKVVNTEARHWVEADDASYDLIILNSIDTFSALSSGAYVLAESYIYTDDAFAAYLEHLRPGGMFALYAFDNDGLAGPTYIIARFATSLVSALQAVGVSEPGPHVAVIASEGKIPMVATLTKREPFTSEEIRALDAFCDANHFSMWQRPDRPTDHLISRVLWATPAERAAMLRDHYLRLDPATDDAPFFFNFYKWKSLLFPSPDDDGKTPSTGQKMLLIMLVQAALISSVLVVWPLRRIRRDSRVRGLLGLTAYFGALGWGFILLEIVIIQRLVLFLGYPTYSLSVTLFALLVSTGIGSAISGTRVLRRDLPTTVVAATAVLAVLVGLFVAFAPTLFHAMLAASLPARIVVAICVVAPMGLVLGLFFPTGVRLAESIEPRLVAWGWGVNGCASVIGTIAAVMLAMAYGFDVVMLASVAAYAVGAAGFRAAASHAAVSDS